MNTPQANAKIKAVCGTCGKTLAVPVAYAGRAVKCPCGSAIKVPGTPTAVAAPTSPATTQPTAKPATATPAASKPVASKPAASKPGLPAPATPNASFFDQLTEADFSRPNANPYEPAAAARNNDAAVLRKYVGEGNKEELKKVASGNITFLAVLNFLGAAVYMTLGVLLLVLSSILGALANVIPLAALGVFLALFLFGFGVFDLVSGIGLIKRKAWGWWIGIIGLGWAMADRGFGIIAQFINAEDYLNVLPAAIGSAFFMFSQFYFLNFMLQSDTMKMFGLKTKASVGWSVALGVGLVLGGGAFAVALLAAASAPDAMPPTGP